MTLNRVPSYYGRVLKHGRRYKGKVVNSTPTFKDDESTIYEGKLMMMVIYFHIETQWKIFKVSLNIRIILDWAHSI